MNRTFAAILSFGAIAIAPLSDVRAETIYDLEHARASARAGGPVSFYDYELLERWGHLGEIRDFRDYRHEGRRNGLKKRRYVNRGGWWR